jgi:hypothetical protein
MKQWSKSCFQSLKLDPMKSQHLNPDHIFTLYLEDMFSYYPFISTYISKINRKICKLNTEQPTHWLWTLHKVFNLMFTLLGDQMLVSKK